MSISKYFTPRTSKVIDDKPIPACSPLPSASSESITTIPWHTGNTVSKSGEAEGPGQLPPIPVTNHAIRTGQHGGEGGAEDRVKGPTSTKKKKKRQSFIGDRAHAPHHSDEVDNTVPIRATVNFDDDNDVFMDNS